MTKISNVILYLLHKQVKHLNQKKLSVMLFLMDYNHQKFCGEKIFNEEYVKNNRNPEALLLSELFNIISNNEDLDEEDERLYLIQELLDYLDIEIVEKKDFNELQFIQMEEEYDEELFSKDELTTIHKITAQYQDTTARNIANDCFKLKEVRDTPKGEIIL